MTEASPSVSSRLLNCFRISLAGWISIGVGIFLIATGVMVAVAFHFRSERISWSEYLSWRQIGVLAALWLAICATSYWIVRIATSQMPVNEKSFSDAWQSGLDALAKRGISVQDIPLFLVLGCENFQIQQSFMGQIGMSSVVPISPQHPNAPIRWFISDDRVLIACQSVGVYTEAQARLESHLKRLQTEMPFSDIDTASMSHDADGIEGFGLNHNVTEFESPRRLESSRHSENEIKTENPNLIPFPAAGAVEVTRSTDEESIDWSPIDDDIPEPIFSPWVDRLDSTSKSFVAERKFATSSSAASTDAHKDVLLSSLNRTEDLMTLVQDELDVPSTADDATTEHLGIEMNPTPSKSVLSSSETIYGQSLLSDLCNKLVNLRGDVAPINGIIVRVDSAALVRCSQLAAQSGQSLRQDLEQLRLQLGIQVPAVIALDNLHQLEGFQHLIKRLGPNKATGISIGELYGITRSISTTNLSVACERLMKSIKRAVFCSFRTDDGSLRPQNHKIFSLLCKCRGELEPSVQEFLLQSLTTNPSSGSTNGSTLLQGIYAMGSGDSETKRGFGGLILKNLMEESENLAWTPARLKREQKYRSRVTVLQSLSVILAGSALIMIWLCIR